MKVSVVIPTYNEKWDLEECIESLGAQTLDDFEIIVVDDGSTDGTLEVLRGAAKSGLVRYFGEKHQGPGEARNLGVKNAKGNILVFVDADMTFDVSFLEKLTEPVRKNFSKGTFSKEEYVKNWDNPWARCWNINEGWEARRRHPKDYPDTQPVFRAILKSEFDKVGGFTPGGYNDDWSLSRKLGYGAQNAPGAIFYHKNPDSLGEVFLQAKWVGKREYKLGFLGYIIALIRTSLPISVVVGLYKSLVIFNLKFSIFKIVYDFGVFVGILEYLITGKGTK